MKSRIRDKVAAMSSIGYTVGVVPSRFIENAGGKSSAKVTSNGGNCEREMEQHGV